MTEARSQHRLGIALVVAAAVFWSTAPFFTRLLAYDSCTILFWRGLFAGIMITGLMVFLQGRASLRDLIRFDVNGWLVASFSTLAMIAFIPALQLTDVSNVAIIIATGPFLAAALAWIWLKEIPHRRTMLASVAALVGVVIIVGGARGGADILGVALACFMALAIAAMTVTVRRHRNTPMIAAAALSNFLGSAISLPFAHGITAVSGFDLLILAMFGCFQVALGLTLFFLGSRLLLSGQAALISTLETPLMPFWIWVGFGDVPTLRVLAGGALVMGAVVADIIGDMRAKRQVPHSACQEATKVSHAMKIGDPVEVVAVPASLPSGMGTQALFEACVGRVFPVEGINECGFLELHVGEAVGEASYMHSIWIEADCVRRIDPMVPC
ncbi:DMT family transporter [Bradyrhizobium roseum]|uniref:DMT family transporter n=1 Tax=Bradyrhizobium roseum TaxID=3056648 RepID=UPI0026162539|nr:DMT family transporter [Bradyrhizobium roseus]WKA30350.1 DMT family transporter [Bradyrhizobium roseus]